MDTSDKETLDITVAPIIAQVYIGIIDGNLKDDVNVKLNLSQAKDRLRFYLRNGNEVWIHTDVQITFGGRYQDDFQLLSAPFFLMPGHRIRILLGQLAFSE